MHLRRGLSRLQSTDLATIGALTREAIERVHAEVAPVLENADDLHDLLSWTVVVRPQEDWAHLWQELVDRGRGRVITKDGVALSTDLLSV